MHEDMVMGKIKMKTVRSVAKRFSVTGSGKIKYKKKGLRHILTKKSTKRKRYLRHSGILHPSEAARIAPMLPYK